MNGHYLLEVRNPKGDLLSVARFPDRESFFINYPDMTPQVAEIRVVYVPPPEEIDGSGYARRMERFDGTEWEDYP